MLGKFNKKLVLNPRPYKNFSVAVKKLVTEDAVQGMKAKAEDQEIEKMG